MKKRIINPVLGLIRKPLIINVIWLFDQVLLSLVCNTYLISNNKEFQSPYGLTKKHRQVLRRKEKAKQKKLREDKEAELQAEKEARVS